MSYSRLADLLRVVRPVPGARRGPPAAEASASASASRSALATAGGTSRPSRSSTASVVPRGLVGDDVRGVVRVAEQCGALGAQPGQRDGERRRWCPGRGPARPPAGACAGARSSSEASSDWLEKFFRLRTYLPSWPSAAAVLGGGGDGVGGQPGQLVGAVEHAGRRPWCRRTGSARRRCEAAAMLGVERRQPLLALRGELGAGADEVGCGSAPAAAAPRRPGRGPRGSRSSASTRAKGRRSGGSRRGGRPARG